MYFNILISILIIYKFEINILFEINKKIVRLEFFLHDIFFFT